MATKNDSAATENSSRNNNMSYNNNSVPSAQEEIINQSRLTNTRLDATLEMITKNMQDSAYLARQSSEIFAQLQSENAAMKQELLYLAKQNENIFFNLSDKIDEISDKNVENKASALAEKIDNLAERTERNENICSALADKINELSERILTLSQTAPAEIDYDLLAEKIAAVIPSRDESLAVLESADEQTVQSADGAAEGVQRGEQEAVQQAEAADGSKTSAGALPVVSVELDEEELADRIALKVGSLKSEDFEILVDDEGCASVSDRIAEKFDYNAIAESVAEKLRDCLDLSAFSIDYDDMAKRISEKITFSGINEDAVADKAAAALSNYLPEIDTDEISDKITGAVVDAVNALPKPTVDNELICSTISERLIESQADHDYDIVIDDEGISKIIGLVYEKIEREANPRFEQLNSEIADIKAMLAGGAVVSTAEIATAAEAAETPADEDAVAETAAVQETPSEEIAEENLVTVSDIVEKSSEEAEDESDDVLDEIDEQLSGGEIMPDGLSEEGVDFVNMMKYNRSFIARIIQSTDEQKRYYGAVKQNLLAYKKVNSSVAWGAERFNKGRETIARFKIRGKTLCLYLALDPNDYQTSVYHHADVSDNKSMSGTPMMIKIKSPLGVKKAIRLIDEMLAKRGGEKRAVAERDYAAMYPYETIEELISDGLVKDVSKEGN